MRWLTIIGLNTLFLLSLTECKKEEEMVNPPETAIPVITLTSPATGSEFMKGENVLIAAEASIKRGKIKSVIFSINGTKMYTDSVLPYQYNWNTIGVSFGEYLIKAVAVSDLDQISSDSSMVKVSSGNPDQLPVVTCNAPVQIHDTSALCSGRVIKHGGSTVVERGICWAMVSGVTIQNHHISFPGDTGYFECIISGLHPQTKYFVRAFASNSYGISYSNEITFTTDSSATSCPPSVYYKEQSYQTVMIGEQCWFAENLNAGNYTGGSSNQYDNGYIEKYCYGEDTAKCTEYGGLYQWDEAMNYSTTGNQGICPDGWHIPDQSDWDILTDYLGGLAVAGGEMKESGTSHWNPPNQGANNSAGFTPLPAGYRDNTGVFIYIGSSALFWTSDSYSSQNTWFKRINYFNSELITYHYSKELGLSIRCLKN